MVSKRAHPFLPLLDGLRMDDTSQFKGEEQQCGSEDVKHQKSPDPLFEHRLCRIPGVVKYSNGHILGR